MQPCDVCGRPADGRRCKSCPPDPARASRNHNGIPRQARGHGVEYERRRALLIGRPCHWGCGRIATTADYDPPWSEGGTLDDLVPSCAYDNYSRGARLRNRGSNARPSPEGPRNPAAAE